MVNAARQGRVVCVSSRAQLPITAAQKHWSAVQTIVFRRRPCILKHWQESELIDDHQAKDRCGRQPDLVPNASGCVAPLGVLGFVEAEAMSEGTVRVCRLIIMEDGQPLSVDIAVLTSHVPAVELSAAIATMLTKAPRQVTRAKNVRIC